MLAHQQVIFAEVEGHQIFHCQHCCISCWQRVSSWGSLMALLVQSVCVAGLTRFDMTGLANLDPI